MDCQLVTICHIREGSDRILCDLRDIIVMLPTLILIVLISYIPSVIQIPYMAILYHCR